MPEAEVRDEEEEEGENSVAQAPSPIEFRCPHCPKIKPSRALLNRHINTHTRPYACHCGVSKATQRDLDRHQDTHGKIRRYFCPVAGCPWNVHGIKHGFSGRLDNAKRHLKSHENHATLFVLREMFEDIDIELFDRPSNVYPRKRRSPQELERLWLLQDLVSKYAQVAATLNHHMQRIYTDYYIDELQSLELRMGVAHLQSLVWAQIDDIKASVWNLFDEQLLLSLRNKARIIMPLTLKFIAQFLPIKAPSLPDINQRWKEHQMRNDHKTQIYSCTYCRDRKLFAPPFSASTLYRRLLEIEPLLEVYFDDIWTFYTIFSPKQQHGSRLGYSTSDGLLYHRDTEAV
ncbi:hypothetical protein BKA65DRAFT_552915 [Rhexocercosporidium sp. MPI-PUGE-AT-0058]|nr:hypothetical protein BKA65DRAFT_552915 [Rhexocercosporidium sp. MPI-PUGE-AT-0058]